ncbi:hypothetical protein ONS96_006941 [Cadophora gregata f. sp. sojae]|nr:hypothetical protein ONS96_006941 [Cadophora gregata f. sp. sojae]
MCLFKVFSEFKLKLPAYAGSSSVEVGRRRRKSPRKLLICGMIMILSRLFLLYQRNFCHSELQAYFYRNCCTNDLCCVGRDLGVREGLIVCVAYASPQYFLY